MLVLDTLKGMAKGRDVKDTRTASWRFARAVLGWADRSSDRVDRGGSWLVFWIERLIPGEGRQAFVNPEHNQELG
jgi:hypothetical protein